MNSAKETLETMQRQARSQILSAPAAIPKVARSMMPAMLRRGRIPHRKTSWCNCLPKVAAAKRLPKTAVWKLLILGLPILLTLKGQRLCTTQLEGFYILRRGCSSQPQLRGMATTSPRTEFVLRRPIELPLPILSCNSEDVPADCPLDQACSGESLYLVGCLGNGRLGMLWRRQGIVSIPLRVHVELGSIHLRRCRHSA